MPSSPPFLEIRDFSLTLGKTEILQSVSFSLQRGERVLLLGLNGTGKSSLLRSIAMLQTHWTGEIAINGLSLRSIPPLELARQLAYTSQNRPEFSSLTVREWITMGRYPHTVHPRRVLTRKQTAPDYSKVEIVGNPIDSIPERERMSEESRIEEALAFCDLTHLADRLASTLSGGEQQRVVLAAALVQNPKLLLLDEPNAFLDLRRREELEQLLTKIHRRGVTLLEITHDLNRAALANHRVLVLVSGKLCYDGLAQGIMTPNHLRNWFGIEPVFVRHPQTDQTLLLPANQ